MTRTLNIFSTNEKEIKTTQLLTWNAIFINTALTNRKIHSTEKQWQE